MTFPPRIGVMPAAVPDGAARLAAFDAAIAHRIS